MSVKATVTIELDGVVHNLSMDDARDLWISLGNVLNPVKKDDPKTPAPKQQGLTLDDINKLFPPKKRVPIDPLTYKPLEEPVKRWDVPSAPYLC